MPEWIAVSNHTPDIDIEVLVYVGMPVAPSGEITLGSLEDDGGWLLTKYNGSKVTHWMPLPDPPD